jgi:hypothetical protein
MEKFRWRLISLGDESEEILKRNRPRRGGGGHAPSVHRAGQPANKVRVSDVIRRSDVIRLSQTAVEGSYGPDMCTGGYTYTGTPSLVGQHLPVNYVLKEC